MRGAGHWGWIAGPGVFLAVLAIAAPALAHGLGGKDAAFVAGAEGADIFPFIYLGAKHMVTGYDHLLFLLGVVFYLDRLRHVVLYVTMFSLGHSTTLLLGVLTNIQLAPPLVDAAIGLSVAWKAFDNMGGFRSVIGMALDNRLVVLAFGLAHGLGLAAKLQGLQPSGAGLIPNMIAFNFGVEIGQLLALCAAVLLIAAWRRSPGFGRMAAAANILLLFAGFLLMDYQLAGFFTGEGMMAAIKRAPGPASAPRLLALTALAFVAAALLTVAFIMPAEFHSDPLGVGKLTGLNRLAGPKEVAITSPPVTAGAPAARHYDTPWRSDEIVIALTAGGREGSELEYKVRMKPGSTLIYSWSETGAPAEEFYTDFHGQALPTRPGADVQVANYRRATGDSASGALVAPLDGVHGWYLQNQAVRSAVVTLKLAGFYELVAPGEVGNEAGIVARGQKAEP